MSDFHAGLHNRTRPDANGWTAFAVYSQRGQWFWQPVDDNDETVGFREGPFSTSQEAYADATAND